MCVLYGLIIAKVGSTCHFCQMANRVSLVHFMSLLLINSFFACMFNYICLFHISSKFDFLYI